MQTEDYLKEQAKALRERARKIRDRLPKFEKAEMREEALSKAKALEARAALFETSEA